MQQGCRKRGIDDVLLLLLHPGDEPGAGAGGETVIPQGVERETFELGLIVLRKEVEREHKRFDRVQAEQSNSLGEVVNTAAESEAGRVDQLQDLGTQLSVLGDDLTDLLDRGVRQPQCLHHLGEQGREAGQRLHP